MMLTLVLIAIIATLFSLIFVNGIEAIQLSKNKHEALNSAQNNITQDIINNNGLTDSMTLIFNEGLPDAESYNIEGQTISETVTYTLPNGKMEEVTLKYFEVVVK